MSYGLEALSQSETLGQAQEGVTTRQHGPAPRQWIFQFTTSSPGCGVPGGSRGSRLEVLFCWTSAIKLTVARSWRADYRPLGTVAILRRP